MTGAEFIAAIKARDRDYRRTAATGPAHVAPATGGRYLGEGVYDLYAQHTWPLPMRPFGHRVHSSYWLHP